MNKHVGSDFDELQLERESHRKTWRQLEQVQREKAVLMELLRRTKWKLWTSPGDTLPEEIKAALSQQPEPTDTFTAVEMATAAAQGFRDGQAAAEQAPAQSSSVNWEAVANEQKSIIEQLQAKLNAKTEQQPVAVIGFYEGEREPRLLSWNVLPNGEHRLYTRPAQAAIIPERKQKGWQCEQGIDPADGWNAALDEVARLNAQTEQQPVAMVDANEDGMWADILPDVTVKVGQMLYAAPTAQPAPQPELVMPVALGSVNADYDKGWADHAAEVVRLNATVSTKGASDEQGIG